MSTTLTAAQRIAQAQAYQAAAEHLKTDWTTNPEERKLSDELIEVYLAKSTRLLAMQPQQIKQQVRKADHDRNELLMQELIGRKYEAIDICMAIQAGQFKSLDELVVHLKTQDGRLDRTIKAAIAGEAFEVTDCCVALKN